MYPYLKFHKTTFSLNMVNLKSVALQFGHTQLLRGESSVVSLSMAGVNRRIIMQEAYVYSEFRVHFSNMMYFMQALGCLPQLMCRLCTV